MMSSSAKKAVWGGVFAAVSLVFSYVETFIPLQYLTGIPGFKLGLANICVMLAVFSLGTLEGLSVLAVKTVLSSVLFGTPISFVFSLAGGIASFLFLIFAKSFLKEKMSLVGVSVACAALHNIGQTAAAAVLFKEIAVFSYLVWLIPVSVVTGILTGLLALAFNRITGLKK